jgi:hypothetical protein
MGGAMLHDNFAWASAMFAYLSQPPDPLLVGEIWRETWLDRLQRSLELWLEAVSTPPCTTVGREE